ncbi:hypothetical protein [Devosia soli]|nr:hypothetical protein [Devosia soli]
MLKKLATAALVLSVMTVPAFAAPEAAVVIDYRLPDGSLKSLLFTAPDGYSLEQCREGYRDQLPTFLNQVEAMNLPEFAGGKFESASCKPYSEDLLK